MDWLVTLAQFIANTHAGAVRISSAMAEGRTSGVSAAIVSAPYAFETLIICWLALTFGLGIREQRRYFRKKPAAPVDANAPVDRYILEDGTEIWRKFDQWGRRTKDWVSPPAPPPAAPAPAVVVTEEKPVKQTPKIMIGGREM